MNRVLPLVLLSFVLTACGGGGGGGPSTQAPTQSGSDSNNADTTWLIPTEFVADGGPGIDGIPSLDYPFFISADEATYMEDHELISGIKHGDVIRAYPHKILDWHEVVNDKYGDNYAVLSYCPLTGTTLGWNVPDNGVDNSYGVSGLLYNSNLLLYDRATGSLWAQMLSQSVFGNRVSEMADNFQVIETTWGVWRTMYPQTQVLSSVTGFSRNYSNYPYGTYKSDTGLFFEIETPDTRIHPKIRVFGIRNGDVSKVYPIQTMAGPLDVINDMVGDQSVVVAGSADTFMAVAFKRTLADGTTLEFTARPGELPIIMDDNDGNVWNIHGEAVSGPRQGEKLQLVEGYVSYWFAWATIFKNPEIYGI